jgi:hypothetical protein
MQNCVTIFYTQNRIPQNEGHHKKLQHKIHYVGTIKNFPNVNVVSR